MASFKSALGHTNDLLDADELRKRAPEIRALATKQLINVWKKSGERPTDPFLWGDEIESYTVQLDETRREAQLIRPPWKTLKTRYGDGDAPPDWIQTELGVFMIETNPEEPLGKQFSDILSWEDSFRDRRQVINEALQAEGGGAVLSMAYFPRLGAVDRHERAARMNSQANGDITLSRLISDQNITHNTRYLGVLDTMLRFRGGKPEAYIPVYRDTNTTGLWREPSKGIPGVLPLKEDRRPDHIYLDTAFFGGIGNALQVTMQATNFDEACMLYDQFIPLTPIMLCLSAAAPIFRGFLANIDSRWPVIESAIDDRSQSERDRQKPARGRGSSNTCYIANDARLLEKYQLSDVERDDEAYVALRKAGMSERLATLFAHTFYRDPLCAPRQGIDEPDPSKTNAMESMMSNVYQLVRFKPAISERLGWRIEFRPMEAQLSDFENTAYCVFIILVARMIVELKPNIYTPLLQVEENVGLASAVNAAIEQRFHFRSNSVSESEPIFDRLSIHEIINGPLSGRSGRFEGLIPLINQVLDRKQLLDDSGRQKINKYLQLISDRASGKSPTTAQWIRRFVRQHPEYQHDSVVSESVTYDLIEACLKKSYGMYGE